MIRGVSSCSKKCGEKGYIIEFDENNQPVGENYHRFMSSLALKCKQMFPYHIETSKFEKSRWDDLWLVIKEEYNIQTDAPKNFIIKKAKKCCTDFRSMLVRDFVNISEMPFGKYKYLNSTHWDEFSEQKTSEKFLARSRKAHASAKANTNFAQLGRSGYRGLRKNFLSYGLSLNQSIHILKT
ncbi:hypothetical protein R6Q59_035893 [Mikania micrantha]